MNELYLCINTNLVAHDLVHTVWEEIYADWFQIACVATDRGEFLAGDLADDTKLDGRGRLALPEENLDSSPSQLKKTLESQTALSSILTRLDTLEITEDPKSFLEISCIGQAPSGFRVSHSQNWLPRLSPCFSFGYGVSSLEITLFDPSWSNDSEELHEFILRLQNLVNILGTHRTSQVEFESDGEFFNDYKEWRSLFSGLPLTKQNY